jgi:hypothetical protein
MINNIFDYHFVTIILKGIFLCFAFMYLVYSFIVFRQVSVMKRTLETDYSSFITLLGLVNLALGIILILIFFAIL